MGELRSRGVSLMVAGAVVTLGGFVGLDLANKGMNDYRNGTGMSEPIVEVYEKNIKELESWQARADGVILGGTGLLVIGGGLYYLGKKLDERRERVEAVI